MLGKLLMELREEMRSGRVDDFFAIEPPEIGDFLVFEKLVGIVHIGDQPDL